MNLIQQPKINISSFRQNTQESKIRVENQESALPLKEFLYHFYEVISRFVKSGEDLSKVFNLYVIQTKRTKTEVDAFRKAYVEALSQFGARDPEVVYMLKLLKKAEREAIDFFMKAKRKVLLFYGLGEKNYGQPLSEIRVKISEWINLLKSFSFFGSENLSRKIENFKQFIIEENEDFLDINAAEFLKAVHAFFLYLQDQELNDVQTFRKGTSRATLNNDSGEKQEPAFAMPVQAFEHRNLASGKPAQKFRQKTPVVLPLRGGKEEQSKLRSFDRGAKKSAEGIARNKQKAHVLLF